jgi:hypothetical protein
MEVSPLSRNDAPLRILIKSNVIFCIIIKSKRIKTYHFVLAVSNWTAIERKEVQSLKELKSIATVRSVSYTIK